LLYIRSSTAVVLNRGGRVLWRGVKKFPGGVRALTCFTTWKVFEREYVPSKHYPSDNYLVQSEMKARVTFLEILQGEFGAASNIQGLN